MIKNFIIGFFIGFIAVAWASATIENSLRNIEVYYGE